MKAYERQQKIIEFVEKNREASFHEIHALFSDVSEMTIRRDLETLSKEEKIIRVLGGAKSISSLSTALESAYNQRSMEQAEEKKLIAKKAVALINNQPSIFIGSGTTTHELAKLIPNANSTITTTGLNCAITMSALEDATIVSAGGCINKNSFSVFGSLAAEMVSDLHFDIAFLGVSGYIPGKGFCTSVLDDYVLRQAIISSSDCVVILMDSSKIGKTGICTFADLKSINYVISDGKLSQSVIQEFNASGIKVL